MACEDFITLIFKKIDGEISPEEDARLTEHMNGCETCREEFSELSALEETLLSLPEYDVPPSFAAEVTKKLRTQGAKIHKPRFKPYFSIAAACIVLVVVLFYNMIDGTLYKKNSIEDTAGFAVAEEAEESADTDEAAPVYYKADEAASEAAQSLADDENNPRLFAAGDGRAKDYDALPTEEAEESQNGAVRTESAMGDAAEYDAGAGGTDADIDDASAPVASMQAVPEEAVLSNSEYNTVAYVSVTNTALSEAFEGLDVSETDKNVYEMSVADFAVFCERIKALGIEVDAGVYNSDSTKVLIIVSVH
ncbi:MAG: zf-HC2 domain-containing protein [Clostridia bacterium]|nr:zf-HC2 domain-containing protein [Clostridia bacterium]